ncbi:hypothetical protein BGW42_004804 [Actinomortierella wolfii]|nr:hypothetical protein BGW42_004804 [Actinomortierella wolfii]
MSSKASVRSQNDSLLSTITTAAHNSKAKQLNLQHSGSSLSSVSLNSSLAPGNLSRKPSRQGLISTGDNDVDNGNTAAHGTTSLSHNASQDTEGANRSTSLTLSQTPAAVPNDTTGVMEGITVVAVTQEAKFPLTDNPTNPITTNEDTKTTTPAEATGCEVKPGSPSATRDDIKDAKDHVDVEGMIEGLDVVKASLQGASDTGRPDHGDQNDHTVKDEEIPQGVDVTETRVGAQDAPGSSSYIEHGSFYSNISLRDDPDLDDMVSNDVSQRKYPRYLTSTAEFFPVNVQDDRVFLEKYSEDADGLPELQYRVDKLQRQVREMRKFMRGMIQLQVEQYNPAAIKIQAWWRGCLVRKELRRQRVFSWHRVPSKNAKKFKYLTKSELQTSCDRLSAPKPSIFVTAEMGAAKEVIAALQFRNLKVQKAFGRVSLKLQYLQGRIATLEESYPVLQDAQDALTKDFDDLSDEVDKLRNDFEQGMKQMDEQAAEERELMTLELKAMTDRVKKLEDDLAKAHSNQANTESQVIKLQKTIARLTKNGHVDLHEEHRGDDGANFEDIDGGSVEDNDDEDDEDEVRYDEEGNRIERPVKTPTRRPSNNSVPARPNSSLGANPAQSMLHRGSVSSLHSHHSSSGTGVHPPPHATRQNSMPLTAARPISTSSVPGSPDQVMPRGAFPSSYSPTIANAQLHPRSHSRQGSVQFSTSMTDANSSFTGSSGGQHHHHPLHSTQRHSMMAAFPPTHSAATMVTMDGKKFASQDDFEYMQAEVDTLRINNDKLESIVRELTAKVNMLMGAASGSSASTPVLASARMPGGVVSGSGGYFPPR